MTDCVITFVEKFVSTMEKSPFLAMYKLYTTSYPVYLKNKPQQSPRDAFNVLIQCISSKIDTFTSSVGNQLQTSSYYLLLLTALFIVAVTIIVKLDKTYYGWIISLSICLALYMGISHIIIKNTSGIATVDSNNMKAALADCINKAINQGEMFGESEYFAINAAMCAYVV